jgi:tetratricopeptide (TPR) repeat protein
MKRLIYLILVICFFSLLTRLQAQDKCATMQYWQHAQSLDPSLTTRMSAIEQGIQNFRNANLQKTSLSIVRVPVVVHVVYNTSSQNISDAQIASQITVLNQDYRRMSGTPGYNTEPVGADVQIEFYLSTIDPSGNTTTGITRTSTSTTGYVYPSTAMKYTSTGGYDAWNTNNYLNIWVVNFTDRTLGYATFPAQAGSSDDGVVIKYSAFGNIGAAIYPYNMGRTATHEIGHYFDLFHTWGDVNDCSGTDYVDDTPPCSGQYYSGSSGTCDKPIQCNGQARQTENYMDYSDDRCMDLFTQGQTTRMRAIVNGARASLFQLSITVDQELEDNVTRVGTIGRWNGSSFPSPRLTPGQLIAVNQGLPEVLQGDQVLYSNQKYNNWKVNSISQPDVTNHRSFDISSTTVNLTSQFRFTNSATIQAQFLEGGSPGGSVNFKDPWLIDSTDALHANAKMNRGMSAPFNSITSATNNLGTSTDYKGVFLNQNTTFDPLLPIYSVSAPSTQMVGSFTGYFQGWTANGATLADSTSNTTAVVFNNAGATVTAKYKGHLLASTNTATSDSTGAHGNNQRRIANDPSGMQYAVYTSGGSIWFTSNLYNSWTGEVLLGTGKNPSIDVTINKWNSTTGVHVVWEQNLGNGNRKIIYRRSTNNGTTWESPISTVQSLSNDATPVVFGNSFPVVVWRGSDSLCVCLNPPAHGPSHGLVNTKVCGTNATSQLPTGVEDWNFLFYTAPRAMYHLFYTDGNSIYYENFQLDTSTFDFIGNSYQNAPVIISAAGGTTGNTNPSCAIPLNAGVYDSVAVAWENAITHKVFLKAMCPDNYGMTITWAGTQQITTNTNLSKPSVCFDMNTWYPLVLFQSSTNIGESVFDGTHWTSMFNLGNGTGPQLPIYYTATNSPTALWTAGSAAPYIVNVATLVTTEDYWSGTQIVQGDVTVDSGATLTISPGTNVLFANGAKLTVNGTLNAIGTSTDTIRFDKTLGSSTWGGIQFTPGSSGSVQYCSISNATNAISLNGTSTPVIANDRIYNCSNYGIYCYSASPHLYHNKIYGVSYGLRCDHYSSPILGTDSTTAGPGNNTIMQCSNGIYASSSSQPLIGNSSSGTAGYNSIYNNTNQDLIAAGCGVVYAQNNWWNGTPKLVPVYTTIYTTPLLSINPNPFVTTTGGSSFAALGSKTPTINASIIGTGTTASSGSDGSSAALSSELNGNYDAAITGYVQKLKADTSSITKKYCIARLSDCYSKGAKKDFSTFLNTNIRTGIKATDELYAATLEVESIHYVQDGSYDKALENYKTLIKIFSKNDDVYKHALFNAGYLYYHQLKDTVQGMKFFAQLKAHYPNDELTTNAFVMHGLGAMLSDTQAVKLLLAEATGTGLVGNYPNPFNPTTTISFQLAVASKVSLKIYDVLGREIVTLVSGEKPAGVYNAIFDGTRFASGMYFARFIVNPQNGKQIVQVKKMLMLK